MPAEIPVQAIAAIATLVAALIAGAISYVNLTMTKEQKTSEFRQAWIDALREDLAAFFACARAFARANEERHVLGPTYKDTASFPIADEKISDIRFQVAEVHYRIRLRLNPEEAEHIKLLKLMDDAIAAQQTMLQQRADGTSTLRAIELAANAAPAILKNEWKRVKAGELPFRLVRNVVTPLIILISLAFLVFIYAASFKGSQ